MNKSVQEIIEDWREQMEACEEPDVMFTILKSSDVLEVIRYFDDIDNFENSI